MGGLTLTPAKHKKIVQAITAGMSHKSAFEYAGVLEQTGKHWIKQGREHIANGDTRTPQAKLVDAMMKAKGNLRQNLHLIIKKNVEATEDFDKAFAFLKHLEAREERSAAGAAQAGHDRTAIKVDPPSVEGSNDG